MNSLATATPFPMPITMTRPDSNPIDRDQAWQQVLARDSGAKFFYGVATTGVFCRPDCRSRRPLPENVRYFQTRDQARSAGFRPCRRCRPEDEKPSTALAKVRAWIERNVDRRITLAELARVSALSPFTVQRSFKHQMGVSPLAYQRALRARALRTALKEGAAVTDAVYEAGFGSPSRAYDGAQLGMAPSRFATGGRGETISWYSAPCSLGWVIVGATPRGLCWLALADSAEAAQDTLRDEFPAATLEHDPSLAEMVEKSIASVDDERAGADLPLDLRGTAFQLRVWQALRSIPRGETRTYSQLARELGDPNATRAVARACATNRVSVLVPCHRVVGVSGSLTGYRWGVDRKRRLLDAEQKRKLS